MTVRELNTLVRDGEGLTLEFKQAEIKPSDLAETFAAMANTRGGVVLIGVNDPGTLVGVPSLTAVRDLVSIAARDCVIPPMTVRASEVRLPTGAVVIVARVSRAKEPVATASGRFMVRDGSRNLAALREELEDLATRDRGGFPYELLSHDFVLELRDSGKDGFLTRTARIRFLQDQVIALHDRVWGEGDLSPARYAGPGAVVDQFVGEDRQHYTLVSLREPKRRGETATVEVAHLFRGMFSHRKTGFDVDVDRPTRNLRVEIRFPSLRPPSEAWLIEKRTGNVSRLTGANLVRGGRGARIVWRCRRPRLRECYRTEWRW